MINFISDDCYWVGADDHSTDLFEALWPLPKGISYNSYLVRGQKTALIDSVPAGFLPVLLDKINRVFKDKPVIDYLVINHMEPDHTASIDMLRSIFPEIKLIGNDRTKDLLKAYYDITDGIIIVNDGDTLDLGDRLLQFHHTPMVHWPETMMTFDPASRVLFSGDAFGGFGTVDEGLYDSEREEASTEDELFRYFSNIIGRYSAMVQKAIDRVKELNPRVIAPTHGSIWRTNPARIIDLYERWNSHTTDPGIVVAYASMYGTTQKAVEAVTGALSEKLVPVTVHNLAHSHLSYVLRDIWKYRGCIFAGPTYNTALFPTLDALLRLVENKLIPSRALGTISSYGWAGGASAHLKEFAKRNKWDLVEPEINFAGRADEATLENCCFLAENMIAKCFTEELS